MNVSLKPLLSATNITKFYGRGKQRHCVLDNVGMSLEAGSCLALVGGSGSGKSTLSRILLGLEKADAGTVEYREHLVHGRRSKGYRYLRQEAGIVFQNPFVSLDPRWTALRSVSEPLELQAKKLGLSKEQIRLRAIEAIGQVGLDPVRFMGRYPVDCSGGQAQRLAIARSIVANPKLLVADEPMSSLDVSARLSLLNTVKAIRKSRPEMAIIVISHDLGMVQHMADRLLVLHDGKIVDEGPVIDVITDPSSKYTRQLIDAAS